MSATNHTASASPFFSHAVCIRQEIERFESVHPNIYAIYDLIENLSDHLVAQQIREHVVSIEDEFVNSPEWTLSRTVPDIRLGVIGSLNSGKSSLVHRYLTGSYVQEESPEGGRFKKDIQINNQSYLLMIRDEGGTPECQFAQWVDAVILVFSLESESSYQEIVSYFKKMNNFRQDIPVVLVGTQDAISENNPRKITDLRARKLAQELNNCVYYETCATYGLNVEKVFIDICHRIVQENRHLTSSRTPSTGMSMADMDQPTSFFNTAERLSLASDKILPTLVSDGVVESSAHNMALNRIGGCTPLKDITPHKHDSTSPAPVLPSPHSHHSSSKDSKISLNSSITSISTNPPPPPPVESRITPLSTPNSARKNKRRSNLFVKDKDKDKEKEKDKERERQLKANGGLSAAEYGSGRCIPVKQGFLLKRSVKGLNKESKKKKYVTLTKDGRLTYHASINDYMGNLHGKEIELVQTTVKIPGQNPRGCEERKNRLIPNTNPLLSSKATPLNKKRSHHKRMKSGSGSKMLEDALSGNEDVEFTLISLACKTWRFEASTTEERDEWVAAIEKLILSSLQQCESAKGKDDDDLNGQTMHALKYQVNGNSHCVDCDAPNPDWASLNHGALMCITCSGIHRNLGSHISRVRSLNLDDWSTEQLSVMSSIGNALANQIWEANIPKEEGKPTPNSSREEKERWIRAKYVEQEFLKNLPRSVPPKTSSAHLVEAIESNDISKVLLSLAHGANVDVPLANGKTPVHVAVAKGNTPIVQLVLLASGREGVTAKDSGVKEIQERRV